MKIFSNILALCFMQPNIWGAVAFSVHSPTKASSITLRSSFPTSSDLDFPSRDVEMFPVEMDYERIEGGKTIRTWSLPEGTDRVQYALKTNGRPLRATVNLWVGPLRQTHNMGINTMDGSKYPYLATIKFKPVGPPTLKISTSSSLELAVMASVMPASPQRCKELMAITDRVWDKGPKTLIQGGDIPKDGGTVRSFPIPNDVDRVQVIFWSKESGAKSLKALIEVLQGPNNKRQVYDLQCGGGSQPYHGIFETPGEGWMIRIYNKKFIEDGLFKVVVVPYNP